MDELEFDKQDMVTVCAALHNMLLKDCENADEIVYVEKLKDKAEKIKKNSELSYAQKLIK